MPKHDSLGVTGRAGCEHQANDVIWPRSTRGKYGRLSRALDLLSLYFSEGQDSDVRDYSLNVLSRLFMGYNSRVMLKDVLKVVKKQALARPVGMQRWNGTELYTS